MSGGAAPPSHYGCRLMSKQTVVIYVTFRKKSSGVVWQSDGCHIWETKIKQDADVFTQLRAAASFKYDVSMRWPTFLFQQLKAKLIHIISGQTHTHTHTQPTGLHIWVLTDRCRQTQTPHSLSSVIFINCGLMCSCTMTTYFPPTGCTHLTIPMWTATGAGLNNSGGCSCSSQRSHWKPVNAYLISTYRQKRYEYEVERRRIFTCWK